MTHREPTPATELADLYGRAYRVGPSDRQLLGHSRRRIFGLCCLLMAAIGIPQYGLALFLPAAVRENHWTTAETLAVLAAFIIVQAAIAYPAARLRDSGLLPAPAAVFSGGMLCAAGLLGLSRGDPHPSLLLAYAVCAGLGAGLIYATSLATVVHWYPERAPTRIGLVTAAYALGVTPPAVLLLTTESTSPTVLFDLSALTILLLTLPAATWLRQPPSRWWPPDVDPRSWSLNKRLNPDLRRNPRPLRPFHPAEAIRTPAFAAVFLLLTAASTVYLGDLACLAVTATRTNFPTHTIVAAIVLLIGVNALTRAVIGPLANRLSRRHLLIYALIIATTAQFVLIAALRQTAPVLLLTAATLAALGAGSCFPLCASLTQDWFGPDTTPQTFGILYTAKAFGAAIGIGAILASPADPALLLPAAAGASLIAAVLTARQPHPGLPRVLLPGTATPQ